MKAAREKLDWYALRWKIEVFHKILKSGCKAEDSLLRSTERLVKLIAVFCVVSWRIFWLTMLNRSDPQAAPGLVLTEEERLVLDRAVKAKSDVEANPNTLSVYLTKVAQLGGCLARRRDPPPGNLVMWRGMRRLADLMLGAQIGIVFMGNRKYCVPLTSLNSFPNELLAGISCRFGLASTDDDSEQTPNYKQDPA